MTKMTYRLKAKRIKELLRICDFRNTLEVNAFLTSDTSIAAKLWNGTLTETTNKNLIKNLCKELNCYADEIVDKNDLISLDRYLPIKERKRA